MCMLYYHQEVTIMIIAHKESNVDGKKQSLSEHLFSVAEYSEETGTHIELANFMYLVGILHDLGKADRRFQHYINNGTKDRVNHSSAGGKYLVNVLAGIPRTRSQKVMNEIIQYIVFSHHGLFDVVNFECDYIMGRRLTYDKDEDYHFEEDVIPFVNQLKEDIFKKKGKTLEDFYSDALKEFKAIDGKIVELCNQKKKTLQRNAYAYYLHCFVRLGLSILKEGDIYDSANVFEDDKTKKIDETEEEAFFKRSLTAVENIAGQFSESENPSELNKNRVFLSEQLRVAGIQNNYGIYKLEMPTGSGKTHASLRYAINNACSHNKKRIFYITAFLSVLEQNAAVIKKTLSDSDYILEHHSNIISERDTNSDEESSTLDYRQKQYLIDSWNSPVVLTTMVQFFQTMFKDKSSNIRRFHQFIDGVIIIDEVQSLPVNVLYHFNLMMNFMSTIMKTSIVLCTATQPALDYSELDYPIEYARNADLAVLDETMKRSFARVDAYNLIGKNQQTLNTNELIDRINYDLSSYKSVLIILNTKKAVLTLYEELKKVSKAKIFYLTTNLCAAHRIEIINEIKDYTEKIASEGVSDSEKIIVVSTQLVEAGVDFDFNVVYRSLSGVDSLIQAAGRCNRNGKLTRGLFKIFKYDEENLKSLKEIEEARNASLYAMNQLNVMNNDQAFGLEELQVLYYEKHYANQTSLMGYNKKGTNLIELLGYNQEARDSCDELDSSLLIAQSFLTAGKSFDLISQETVTVIVPYFFSDTHINVLDYIEELHESIQKYDFNNVKKVLKKLQPYTIQVYDIGKMKDYVEELMDGSINILLKEYYDEKIGLNISALQLLLP